VSPLTFAEMTSAVRAGSIEIVLASATLADSPREKKEKIRDKRSSLPLGDVGAKIHYPPARC
jgi:hypothetical protein